MKDLTQYKHWFLVTVTLFVTALESLPRIALHLSGNVFRPKLYGGEFNINFSLYILTVDTLLSFLILVYVNYAWREKLIFRNFGKIQRLLLIVLSNILILILFAQTKSLLYTLFYDIPLNPRLHFVFYMKSFFIVNIALLSTYILYLISKTKIIEIENLKLKRENMEAQYTSLKDQINPHFLFNTLNSLSAVIRTGEKDESLRFVDKMSEVYRYILESNEYKTVKISRELRFLEAYIFMIEKRFGRKFRININLQGENMSSLLPPLALQILVENAVKHNKITELEPLEVSIYSDAEFLVVENNLQKKRSEPGYGIGLANLRNRYRLLGDKEIEIYDTKDKFIVKLPILNP